MRGRKGKGLRFAFVCVLALTLLFSSLLTQIRLGAARDEIRALEREKAELICEKRILSVRLAERLPLAELERLAAERLGMRRLRADQSVTLDWDGG